MFIWVLYLDEELLVLVAGTRHTDDLANDLHTFVYLLIEMRHAVVDDVKAGVC